MRTLLQDTRYALRSWRRNPGFSLTALLTLALGTGAAIAIFSVVDEVLIRPLPYPEPARLVSVATRFPGFNLEFLASSEYVEWRRENHVVQNLAAYPHNPGSGYMTVAGESAKISATRVSDNFFETLGVRPLLGRGFLPEETRPGGPDVIVFAHGLWQRAFAADPAILGRTVTFEGRPFTVVGVLPEAFSFPEPGQIDAFTPLPIPVHPDRRQMSTWNVIGRLQPGVSLAQARTDFERLFQLTRRADPAMYKADVQLRLLALDAHRVQNVRLTLLVLSASVTCVLLIACANVAALLLARAAARQTELSIRATLGAGRFRLLRQALTESILLALAGGLAGVVMAAAAVRFLARFGPRDVPGIEAVSIDPRILGFAILLCVLTGLIFGAAPALAAARTRLTIGAPTPAGSSYRPLRRTLVIGELALSLILMTAAGLLIESLSRLQRQDLGFTRENVLTADVFLAGVSLPARRQLLQQLEAIPGTLAVAFADGLPPFGGGRFTTFARADRPRPEPWHRGDNVIVRQITPDYFRALGIALRTGRSFTASDRAEMNGVAIINQTLAHRYFPAEDPLGKRVDGLVPLHWKTIVGVVEDSKNIGLDQPVAAEIYEPLEWTGQDSNFSIAARTAASPTGAVAAFRGVLRDAGNPLPVTFQTMDQSLSRMVARPRFHAVLFGLFAMIAWFLAVVGTYGVLSYSVVQRTSEIGIRMALGAGTPDIVKLIGFEAMALTMSGVLFGLAGARWTTRLLASQLYSVKPDDAVTLATVASILMATAALAAWIPARRAAAIDPMLALRS